LQKRSVAIATALILLSVGLLARHHEAEAAHVREASGRMVHAQELADHHESSTNAHLHGREVHAHAGDCSLLAIAHAPALHAGTLVVAAAVELTTSTELAPLAVTPSVAAIRFAPKTSPPSA
jgi:hypothetical protein